MWVLCRDTLRDKAENMEREARLAKEQLTEMARTATEYTNMISKKEEEISRLESELDRSKQERETLLKEIAGLQGDIDTLTEELRAQQDDNKRGVEARTRLQEELDELRSHLEAKTTEETRRMEVDKSKEMELADLRSQVSNLSQDLSEARKQALEGQNKLKVELDSLLREHHQLEQSHKSLSDKELSSQSKLKDAEAALSDAVKAKRGLESDLQSVRSRQIDLESQLAGALKERDVSSWSFPLSTAKTHILLGSRTQALDGAVEVSRLRGRRPSARARQGRERSSNGG